LPYASQITSFGVITAHQNSLTSSKISQKRFRNDIEQITAREIGIKFLRSGEKPERSKKFIPRLEFRVSVLPAAGRISLQ
jgi:hypothetical protein